MARRLFLFLTSCLIGVFCNPYILTAADHYAVKDLNRSSIVETVVVEAKEEPVSHQEPELQSAPTYSVASAASVVVASAPAVPANNIQIAGRTLQVVDVADTAIDSGSHVNRYGGQFYYGHNSGAVFGGLAGLGIGNIFSITLNGITTNYQIANIAIYEKNTSTGQLQLNGAGNYMLSVARAQHNGIQYGISIMTCAGTSYGNGDASHRLVIFANAV